MLGGEAPTPLDLRFRLGPIPVRVSPWFWLIMALLGSGVVAEPMWAHLLLWVGCGFVSVLVHELGHALAYRLFGSWSAITLHGFGGYAETPHPPTASWKRLAVAVAGPAAGFALCGAAFAALTQVDRDAANPYLYAALRYLFVMNLFWNVFNLLPVLPLDGGKVFRELAVMAGARQPDVLAHGVSVFVAGGIAAYSVARIAGVIPPNALPEWVRVWLRPSLFMTLWFALLAIENYQMMQLYSRRRPRYYEDYDDDTPPWRR